MSERRHPPTPRRLREARREGRVAFSREPGQALVLLLVSAGMTLGSPLTPPERTLTALLQALLELRARPDAARTAIVLCARALVHLLGPLLFGMGLLGLALGLWQTRGLLTTRPLRVDPARVSPRAGLRRLLSPQRLFATARGAVGATLALMLAGWAGVASLPDLLRLCGVDTTRAPIAGLLGRVLFCGGGAATLVALADVAWQRRRLRRSLFMTETERRDETRREEGDPSQRSARHAEHRRLLRPAPPLKEARVVVLNPTHLAIALHHDTIDTLPFTGRRAAGRRAAHLRTQARRRGIPLLRDRALARALWTLPPGEPIPRSLYRPVADLLAAVYRAGLAEPPPSSRRTSP